MPALPQLKQTPFILSRAAMGQVNLTRASTPTTKPSGGGSVAKNRLDGIQMDANKTTVPTTRARLGQFLTLEGIDGAGKSSHINWAAGYIRDQGIEVVTTREPGGTPLGDQIRSLLLNTSMTPATECLLLFAGRAEHLAEVINPALTRGAWVISDRFTDATYAYQCGGRGMVPDRIAILESWTQQGQHPDRTWLFDVPLAVAKQRRTSRNDTQGSDRFESEPEPFHQRVQTQYMQRARAHPERFLLIDARQSIHQIRGQLATDLDGLLKSYRDRP
jgi:dTMP kinase